MLRLDEDHHVHSTYSHGGAHIPAIAERASHRGLAVIGFADRVNRHSYWLGDYVRSIQSARVRFPDLRIAAGVEAALVDASGSLELPPLPGGIDQVVIAQQELPTEQGPVNDVHVRAALTERCVTLRCVVEMLVAATCRAIERCERPVIVGQFGDLLHRLGVAPEALDPRWLDPLFETCLRHRARLEVNEDAQAPSVDVVKYALQAGVWVVASSDSRQTRTLGQYRYVAEVADLARRDLRQAS